MSDVCPELKNAVEARMNELGMSPNDLADATGLTLPGLANVRRGLRRDYHIRTKRAITAALGWTPDSIDRLLAGNRPKLATGVRGRPAGASGVGSAEELRRLEQRLTQMEHVLRTMAPAFEELGVAVHANGTALSNLGERVARLEARRRGRGDG